MGHNYRPGSVQKLQWQRVRPNSDLGLVQLNALAGIGVQELDAAKAGASSSHEGVAPRRRPIAEAQILIPITSRMLRPLGDAAIGGD